MQIIAEVQDYHSTWTRADVDGIRIRFGNLSRGLELKDDDARRLKLAWGIIDKAKEKTKLEDNEAMDK